jgi:aminoglycoside phosphotransferase (APT) family kinase protein
MDVMQSTPAAPDVEAWLRRLVGFEGARVLAVTPFDGGASNITCKVTLEGAPKPAVVLRVQRERGIFEPYDVIREGEVLRRLRPSRVPVPEILGTERDPAALGAPFIVMEWVDAPHMGEAGPEASYPAFTAMVAEIHRVPWKALDLGFLGVPSSPRHALLSEVEAVELRRMGFEGADAPVLSQAVARLRETAPADGVLALCQGDINVFNYLFRRGEVAAVVDWEQARIGDPRSDMGQLVALAHLKGAPFCPANEAPFVQMYEAVAGREAGPMAWFRALWAWELGVIYHGWKAFSGSQPWYSWEDVSALLEASLAEL